MQQARADGVTDKSKIRELVNTAITKALEGAPDRDDYIRRSNEDKEAKRAQRDALKEKGLEDTPAKTSSDAGESDIILRTRYVCCQPLLYVRH